MDQMIADQQVSAPFCTVFDKTGSLENECTRYIESVRDNQILSESGFYDAREMFLTEKNHIMVMGYLESKLSAVANGDDATTTAYTFQLERTCSNDWVNCVHLVIEDCCGMHHLDKVVKKVKTHCHGVDIDEISSPCMSEKIETLCSLLHPWSRGTAGRPGSVINIYDSIVLQLPLAPFHETNLCPPNVEVTVELTEEYMEKLRDEQTKPKIRLFGNKFYIQNKDCFQKLPSFRCMTYVNESYAQMVGPIKENGTVFVPLRLRRPTAALCFMFKGIPKRHVLRAKLLLDDHVFIDAYHNALECYHLFRGLDTEFTTLFTCNDCSYRSGKKKLLDLSCFEKAKLVFTFDKTYADEKVEMCLMSLEADILEISRETTFLVT